MLPYTFTELEKIVIYSGILTCDSSGIFKDSI